MTRVGFVTVDEGMGLDALKIVLEKNGQGVPVTIVQDPELGRYEVHLEAADE